MTYTWKGALYRLARALFYGAVAYGVEFVTANLSGYNIPDIYIPAITAVLMSIDKWVREKKAEL